MRVEGGGAVIREGAFLNYGLSGECLFGVGGHLLEHGLLSKETQ